MNCIKCKKEIPDGSMFCMFCGKKLTSVNDANAGRRRRTRGNGTGSVYKLPNGKYRAAVTLGYTVDESGKVHRLTRCKDTFSTKKEALEYLPRLKEHDERLDNATFGQIYDLWYDSFKGGMKALNGYKTAYKKFESLFHRPFAELTVNDYQKIFDAHADMASGSLSKMKTLLGLLYKYAIPRGYTKDGINHGTYVVVKSNKVATHRNAFSVEEVELIRKGIDNNVYLANYIYCMIYTGFRPNEFLDLTIEESYNAQEKTLTGGGKTEAGTNRTVTLSPKIIPVLEDIIGNRAKGYIFCSPKGTRYGDRSFARYFEMALPQCGINRKLTPYSTRHTFATLMMRVDKNADKQKLNLMGHTNAEMLRHYQHPDLDDLREVTDKI